MFGCEILVDLSNKHLPIPVPGIPAVRAPNAVSVRHHRFDLLSGMLKHQKQHNMIAIQQHNEQKASDRAAALADTEGALPVAAGVSRDFTTALDGGGNPYSFNVAVPRFKNYLRGHEAARDLRVEAGRTGRRHEGYRHSGGGQHAELQNTPAPAPTTG